MRSSQTPSFADASYAGDETQKVSSFSLEFALMEWPRLVTHGVRPRGFEGSVVLGGWIGVGGGSSWHFY